MKTTIVTHTYFHLDEVFAIWLLKKYGGRIFPRMESARIEFLSQTPNRLDPGTIAVGIGGAKLGEFDEHRPEGRLQNCCASTLVARRLGLENKEGIGGFLREVLWCDTHQKVNCTHLASLVKAMHRMKDGNDQFGTYLWTEAAIEAAVFGEFDEAYDIRRAWKNYREDTGAVEVGELENFINQAHGQRRNGNGELASICARMRRETRQKWLPEVFGMLYRDHNMFEAALAEVKAAEVIEVETDNGCSEPVVLIASDNPLVAKAASSVKTGKNSLTVIRSGNGRTAIMCDIKRNIGLVELAAMIRMAEHKARTGQRLSYEKVQGLGTVKAVENWHLANENLLLNGSFSHPKVAPSKLSLEDIAEIAKKAFMKTQREAWLLWYRDGDKVATLEPKELELAL